MKAARGALTGALTVFIMNDFRAGCFRAKGELEMSYAIIRSGGKQFRVAEGETVRLPSIDTEAGESVELEALVIGGVGDGETRVGAPVVDGARVTGTVVEHGRGDKIIVFKKKRRKQYKRTRGHRQDYTAVKIDSIG